MKTSLTHRAALFLCAATILPAAVARIEIAERSAVLEGRSFGAAGAYERIRGRVYFAVDPKHPANSRISDVTLAPRDDKGLVHFSADLYVLRPVDGKKGNRTILFEVVNRGKKGMLSTFNRAQGSLDPQTAGHFGDGTLLNAGYTLVWLGWQHDVPVSPELMRIEVPSAGGVSGWVRGEFTPDKPVEALPLGDAGHVPYAPAAPPQMTLSVRDGVHGQRVKLPPDQWSIGNGTAIRLKSPAQPGRIYEFIYKSADPAIAGLGLAAIRDLISHYKRSGEADFAIGFGTSQSAMVLRALVYEGFNADESGKKVFDGIFAHVAGSRRSAFPRFAQPSRTAGPLRNASLSPTEQFPFSDIEQADPLTDSRDGILKRAATAKAVPRIFYTNSAYEYWGSAGSLLHTTPDGSRDVELPAATRLYVYAGGQHGPASFPPQPGRGQNLANFNDYRWSLRALLPHLQAWVTSGTLPPASVYPTIRDKKLVPVEAYRFPSVPDMQVPKTIHTPTAVKFSGAEPPRVLGFYRSLVPQADKDGNDLGGVSMPEITCAIGTWTGWNLRSPAVGASTTLLANTGSYLPFRRSEAERTASADPRQSLQDRFSGQEAYAKCVEQASISLSNRGFLLRSDIPNIMESAIRHWQWQIEADIRQSAAR
jgi:hypothetical protein